MKNKILIIDIETTGLNKETHEIVELGIVELDLSSGKMQVVYDKAFRPNRIDNLESTFIAKYMPMDEILGGIQLIPELPKIQNIINMYPSGATAFNSSFDFEFMEKAGVVFPKKLDCLMKLSTNIVKCPPTWKMKKYRPEIMYKPPTAQEAYNHFYPRANYIEKHRGADDAFHEAGVALQLYKIGALKI